MAHLIDTATYEIVANVLVDSRPRFAEYSPDGKHLFVTAEIGGTVSVIDTGSNEIIGKIEFAVPGVLPEALQPVGLRITADGAKGYVALGPANRVAVFDAKSFEVLDYLLVGQRVWQLGFSPDGKFLYTTNGNSNDLSVIDVATDKVTKSVQVGEQPWGVVAVP
jgi:PQQ-dependent catabolism-associated beta-propeller protein